jgi:hypothetical protein
MLYYEKLCHLLSYPNQKRGEHFKEVIELVKNAELFLIHPKNEIPSYDGEFDIFHDPEGYKGHLDSPFKTIWIEMGELNGIKYKVSVSDKSCTKNNFNHIVNCLGLLVHEVSPKLFRIWALMEMYDSSGKSKVDLVFIETSLYSEIAKQLIERINQETWGLESIRTKVRIGSGSSKTIRRIKSIIHITEKRNTKKIDRESKKIINWSHAWNVRGHWRKINGVGKGRDGVELVLGHTWVNSYIKGNGELIKKTRIVNV